MPADMQTFNRTIVELKPLKTGGKVYGTVAFNRTIVELKHAICPLSMLMIGSFNRTIVELKLDIDRYSEHFRNHF